MAEATIFFLLVRTAGADKYTGLARISAIEIGIL
jgi:hypothetical protein